MTRQLTIGAAQSGPIPRDQSRADALERLIVMLREGHKRGCELVVFTECALTAFFPHWLIEDPAELDTYFESQLPGPDTQALFDEARRLGVGFHLGFAELAEVDGEVRHFNSSVLVGPDGAEIGRFRKIHLPGYSEPRPDHSFQNLEKRYFDVGDLGFQTWRAFGGTVGLCICNDRRWPETYRVLGLRGAELILLGYNTPSNNPDYPEMNSLVSFHNRLSMQSGAYQNGAWVVGVAKAGEEEGVMQLGQTMIIAPSGEVVAQATTLEDELVVHTCDLDATRPYKEGIFHFGKNRRIEHYGPITSQTEAELPG